MERKGAAYRISATRPGGGDAAPRLTSYPWSKSNEINTSTEAYDDETRVSMSVSPDSHGGHMASVVREDDYDPESGRGDRYGAGPFRTPQRAQIAAEALGNRVVNHGDTDQYHRERYHF